MPPIDTTTEQDIGASLRVFRVLDREATLPVRVAREIERFIVEHRLTPGHRMPSERDLARQFGVSRTVIREGMRLLGAQGLLEVRAGDGTYVRDPGHGAISAALARLLESTDHNVGAQARALQEVRRPLAMAIAQVAAERATATDLETLAAWAKGEVKTEGEESPVSADVGFHLALARASHNSLFVALLESMRELLQALPVGLGGMDAGHHRQRILDRVAARDPQGAARAMGEYMSAVERTVEGTLARDNVGGS